MNKLCRCYDAHAAKLGLTPRPPSLIFNSEAELVAHFNAEMAKKGLKRYVPMRNFEVLLPSGRVMPYFAPQLVGPAGGNPIEPRGDEDAVGTIIAPGSEYKAYVWLNERSPRFRPEDREHAEPDRGGWRYYFKTFREASEFLDAREQ